MFHAFLAFILEMSELFKPPLKNLLQKRGLPSIKDIAVLQEFLDEKDAEKFLSILQQTPDPRMALTNFEKLYSCDSTAYLKSRILNNPKRLQLLLALLSHSQAMADTLSQNPQYLPWLFEDKNLYLIKSREDLLEELSKFMLTYSIKKLEAILAKFKRREYLRIGLRDILQLANISETTSELSNLADVILEKALSLSMQELNNKYGIPQFKDESGRINEAEFCIISLGKLGAMELNYSSDIDIIFIYSEEGKTSGVDNKQDSFITNHEFFIKLAERITKLLTTPSEEGISYRIDLRLRPQGSNGELANSLNNCLSYYRRIARLWERQALIKARVSAGSHQLGTTFIKEIMPIVYPYKVKLDLLREIKTHKDKINRKLALKGKTRMDLKLGYGGIRELEFIIQALQLLYGGEDEWIREGNSLIALMRLADKDFISYHQYSLLSEAYSFLRMAEHRLQILHNLWTYSLPADEEELDKLARRMGFLPENGDKPYTLFLKQLNHYREIVRSNYDQLFLSYAQPSMLDKKVERGRDILLGNLLQRKKLIIGGFRYPEQANKYLKAIYRSISSSRNAPFFRMQFDNVATTIISLLIKLQNPDRGMRNFQKFIIAMGSQEKDWSMLFNNKLYLQSLLRLFCQSDFLSEMLMRKPSSLRRLCHSLVVTKLKARGAYLRELSESIQKAKELKDKMEQMRLYLQQEQLVLGFLDVNQKITMGEVRRHLSYLAEACLQVAYKIAIKQLTSIYGQPKSHKKEKDNIASFAILSLGRLGTGELDFNSDIDLVFVFSHHGETSRKKIANREFFKRLVELIIRIVSSITKDGFLYRIDTRLRPGGMDGELAQSLPSLVDYLSHKARIWQKQSFLKARFLAGEKNFGRRVLEKIEKAVFANINRSNLSEEINNIRERLLAELGRDKHLMPGIKSSAGSLFDIDFITQYLWLKHNLPFPLDKNLPRMLRDVREECLLNKDDYKELLESYNFLSHLEHQLRLLYDRPLYYLPKAEDALNELGRFMGYKQKDPAKVLKTDFSLHVKKVGSIYKKIMLNS